MKKSVLSVILGASLMVSSSAFALTAMTDSNMKDATGQAGVSIALDDITLYQAVGATTYTDTDGLNGSGPASIKITGAETLTTIRAIMDDGNRGGFLKQDYTALMTDHAGSDVDFTSASNNVIAVDNNRTGYEVGTETAIGAIEMAPLTIDVSAKVQALSYGMAFNHKNDALAAYSIVTGAGADFTEDNQTDAFTALAAAGITGDAALLAYSLGSLMVYTGDADTDAANSFDAAQTGIRVAGVVIGLPTIEIAKTGSMKTISAEATGSVNSGDAYIAVKTGDSSIAVLGGYIEICPH